MVRRREESRVLFPWERRRGLRSVFRRTRARQIVVVLVAVVALVALRRREAYSSEVRQTRESIAIATKAIDAWRADHDWDCPPPLADLVSRGYLSQDPLDAWGRPLRVTCPSRAAKKSFDVTSDGPDGEPGGLDRIE